MITHLFTLDLWIAVCIYSQTSLRMVQIHKPLFEIIISRNEIQA